MTKKEILSQICQDLSSLLEGEKDVISNLSNTSSLIYHSYNENFKNALNWVGFYLVDKFQKFDESENVKNSSKLFSAKNINIPELVLGPFQGKVACTRIRFDRGVCGECATKRMSIVVPNVHEFPGHVACDGNSNSEVCVPMFNEVGKLIGLLDVDSVNFNEFGDVEKDFFENVVLTIQKHSDMSRL